MVTREICILLAAQLLEITGQCHVSNMHRLGWMYILIYKIMFYIILYTDCTLIMDFMRTCDVFKIKMFNTNFVNWLPFQRCTFVCQNKWQRTSTLLTVQLYSLSLYTVECCLSKEWLHIFNNNMEINSCRTAHRTFNYYYDCPDYNLHVYNSSCWPQLAEHDVTP